MSMTRRQFVVSTAGLTAATVGCANVNPAMATTQPQPAPVPYAPSGRPLAVGSANALRACDRAVELLRRNPDPVDAVVAGVNIIEEDPDDRSVGYGGLPNEDGVVECDACVMHGPTHKAGAVAALRSIRTPASVARLVMTRTDHVLLVGEGALRFARAHGFREQEMLTEESRRAWLRWKETLSNRDDWLPPRGRDPVDGPPDAELEFTHGTITCLALTPQGDIGGCTSTSGLSYKLAGRVGDSPIIGAGLYVDNEVGACGSTGRGEANLINCSCFHVVQLMRAGATPEEAARRVLTDVARRTERRLRNAQGDPTYSLTLYALRRDGLFGGATLVGEDQMAVHEGTASRLLTLPGLYPAPPERPRKSQ